MPLEPAMNGEPYEILRERVDATVDAIRARRSADLVCKRGCTACCHVQLTVSPLEAERVRAALARLDLASRERVRERARALEFDERADRPCALLEPDGACAIYSDRPLVCRTQGHALLYPPNVLPEDAVFATVENGAITWCPLNFTESAPKSEDVLDCRRIDELLALASFETNGEPESVLERVELRTLAAE